VGFSPASRNRLTDYDLDRFPGATLLDHVARAACHAACLPRKELYEAWETARRVRRLLRGGRIVDLAAGHCLLAHLMLILDDTSPQAVAVDQVVRNRNPANTQTVKQPLPMPQGVSDLAVGEFVPTSPEPELIALVGIAGAMAAWARRRRKRAS